MRRTRISMYAGAGLALLKARAKPSPKSLVRILVRKPPMNRAPTWGLYLGPLFGVRLPARFGALRNSGMGFDAPA